MTSVANRLAFHIGRLFSMFLTSHCTTCSTDPRLGPRVTGWKKYDPKDSTTLAILGLSTSKADAGDHFAADSSCTYWNQILPQFPQVSISSSKTQLVSSYKPLNRPFRSVEAGRAKYMTLYTNYVRSGLMSSFVKLIEGVSIEIRRGDVRDVRSP